MTTPESPPGTYLLIDDTTALNYEGLAWCQGLGPIGESYTRGLWVHNTLAVKFNTEQRDLNGDQSAVPPRVLGLADQQIWARDRQVDRRGEQMASTARSAKAQRLERARESARWGRLLASVHAPADDQVRWIYVADRESDIYEVFARCQKAHVHWVIRAAYDRALSDVDAHVFQQVAQSPLRAEQTIHVRRRAGRQAPRGVRGRQAKLQLRAQTVRLRGPWRPGGKLGDRWINVVEVREVDARPRVEPLCWRLLTDLPIDTADQIALVVVVYRQRFLIEELHKAMKTGLKVESSQHDGPPGWLTLWRGWQRLQLLTEGYRLAQATIRTG